MRIILPVSAAAAVLLAAIPAHAQRFEVVPAYEYADQFAPRRAVRAPAYAVQQGPHQRGNMGGGLFEAMFGDDNAPRVSGQRYQQLARGEPSHITVPDRRPMDPKYLPQSVEYHGKEGAGTIVVDTASKFLYLVEGDGRARRYGIGVGREGFTWSGTKTITNKREWPDWRPPKEMLQRRPDLPTFMAGGPENPLGARALYLGTSLYRIHGSNEPWTIGTNVSSGCIRMRNEDVTDLYDRVKVGTRVVVM
ncbi:putative L,D-transpeptidase ErfK/SrfK precursor [Variibacter gotjawalensis]|uniref:Putative L,D-transpeptidase ErfK/SrfK n=1 Tax=Variibacter gotjawalensis TaxID=1333996 RepID=A0A0S3PSA2_9BRAD|nr:L,D-transpeptidase [Variibacter gotjawalensis]NIK49012.1 lipoprotein-anchoring transpeptidase ErfK/SrfK [Variibacter gotjawalensis]RZS50868.1 L,D-transpeptidase-like protein [Variibacter gotjawalensis]BAT58702.1 putative L,D-transpeptidase ErfK/SrfK precursor [Variibacter gotjawalensis]